VSSDTSDIYDTVRALSSPLDASSAKQAPYTEKSDMRRFGISHAFIRSVKTRLQRGVPEFSFLPRYATAATKEEI
jgi:hypothetical protein